MTLIEGIGDEVTQFFIILFAAVIAYIAWWSTNISEQRRFRTVLLLNRVRRDSNGSIIRVRLPFRPLSNHTETIAILGGPSSNHTTSVQTEESTNSTDIEEANTAPETSPAEPKSNITPSSSNTSQTSVEETNSENNNFDRGEVEIERPHLNLASLEENTIIRTMDADTQNELRQRRVAHFEGAAGIRSGTGASSHSKDTQSAQNSPIPDMLESDSTESHSTQQPETVNNESQDKVNNITIKLKYINDDMRIVDGQLEELLGDFKRRHFMEELNANKEIKLIFNGQVLKQDRNNLQSCGLFDNCVVHCLIHQKRPSAAERNHPQENFNENTEFLREVPFIHVTNADNNNQDLGWDLSNCLFAIVSFILLAAWYFRYVYAHLYTITATVGLIIITGIFSIILLGAYFPDSEAPPDASVQIQVSRTERIEVQPQQ